MPAVLRIEPAEFTRDGLVIYTTDGSINGRTEPPSKANGWNPMEFAFDPARVGQVKVLEAPSRANNFNRRGGRLEFAIGRERLPQTIAIHFVSEW
jgi:hypothetical protein